MTGGAAGNQRSLFTQEGQYVAPVIAEMYGATAGSLGAMERAKVTITNIDEVFSYILSEQQSIGILNLFSVADADQSGDANIFDSSANVTVGIRDLSGSFKPVIVEALGAALSSGPHRDVNTPASAANCTPAVYLRRQAYDDTMASLRFDTLANLLAADDLASFTCSLDVSGGASSLVAKLAGASAEQRKALFTQLPESNSEKYLNAEDLSGINAAEDLPGLNYLPFVVGDKFVFVFDTTVGATTIAENTAIPSSGAVITRAGADAGVFTNSAEALAGAAGGLLAGSFGEAGATNGGYADGSLRFSAPTRRRIALALMVTRNPAPAAVVDPDAADQDLSGEGFVLKFRPETDANDYLVDPAADNYSIKLASGMLNALQAPLDLSSNVPAASGVTPQSYTDVSDSATIDTNLSDLSDGNNWMVVPTMESLIGAASGGHYGRYAVIPEAGNKNHYRVARVGTSGNTWKVECNAMVATAADAIKLHYIENSGHAVSKDIAVTVNVNFSA